MSQVQVTFLLGCHKSVVILLFSILLLINIVLFTMIILFSALALLCDAKKSIQLVTAISISQCQVPKCLFGK